MFFNASGGRKVQSMAVSGMAALMGIDRIFSVVNKKMKNYNEAYERHKDTILSFLNAGPGIHDMASHYNRNRRILDRIFFPDSADIEIMETPIIRIPDDVRSEMRRAIEGVDLESGDIPDFRIRAYRDSGLITFDRSRTYANTLGSIILKLL